MYNGIANEGMRCIKEILRTANRRYYDIPITFDVFETRLKDEVPDMSYDILFHPAVPVIRSMATEKHGRRIILACSIRFTRTTNVPMMAKIPFHHLPFIPVDGALF